MPSEFENPAAGDFIWRRNLLALVCCILLSGCKTDTAPSIEFSRVHKADEGGASKIAAIEGRVMAVRPGQRIVLYARSGAWYVLWEVWWFWPSVGLVCLSALLAFHRLRLRQLTRRLNARFEERLDERMRIAQELHDTLLQGVLSASMQLSVAVEPLPEDSSLKMRLNHVGQLMGNVIEEGRNTVQGLRSITTDSLDLEQAFSRIPQELAGGKKIGEQIGFRVIVEGRPRPLHPIIRDEVYRIGREALVTAVRNSQAKSVEVELKYKAKRLRILVRDDGCAINPQTPRQGSDVQRELSGMRERAERIGARLKVRSRAAAGTEVELSVPSRVAFLNQSSTCSQRWFAKFSPQRAAAWLRKLGGKRDE